MALTKGFHSKFNLITTGVGHCSVSHFIVKVLVEAWDGNGVAVGDGVHGVEPEIVLVGINKNGVLAVGVEAGLAMIQEIGICGGFDQVADADDAIRKLVIEL